MVYRFPKSLLLGVVAGALAASYALSFGLSIPSKEAQGGVLALPPAEFSVAQANTSEGLQLYTDFCAACHEGNGRGGIGPSLVGSSKMADTKYLYRQIARGGSEMPPFEGTLTHEQMLVVGTYVMNAWGNSFGELTNENSGAAQ